MEFFSFLFEGYTVLLYIVIMLTAALLSGLSQNKSGILVRPMFFIMSFLVLWVFIFFSYTGVDMENYTNEYRYSSLSWEYILSYNQGYQGFAAVTGFIHQFVKDPLYGIGCVKTLCLVCVYSSFYLMRRNINLGYAVLIFSAVYYLYGFSAIKWSLSGSLCLLSSTLFFLNRRILALFLSLLATTVHVSVIAFFLFQIFALFLRLENGFNIKKTMIIMFSMIALLVSGYAIIANIASTGMLFYESRFDYTMEDNTNGIGLGQLIKFIPLIIFVYSGLVYSKKSDDTKYIYLSNYSLYYSMVSLTIGILGYKIGQIGRLDYSLSFPFIVFIPFIIQHRVPLYVTKKLSLNHSSFRILIVLYIFLRFVFQLSVNYHGVGLEVYHSVLF